MVHSDGALKWSAIINNCCIRQLPNRCWVSRSKLLQYNVTLSSFLLFLLFFLFSPAEECQMDQDQMLIPIIVGAALAGLVLIVLIAYLIGRKRSHAGYQTIWMDPSFSLNLTDWMAERWIPECVSEWASSGLWTQAWVNGSGCYSVVSACFCISSVTSGYFIFPFTFCVQWWWWEAKDPLILDGVHLDKAWEDFTRVFT